MSVKTAGLAVAALLVIAPPALAQDSAPDHAIGSDVTFSTDADKTDILRVGANLDWRYKGPEDY